MKRPTQHEENMTLFKDAMLRWLMACRDFKHIDHREQKPKAADFKLDEPTADFLEKHVRRDFERSTT